MTHAVRDGDVVAFHYVLYDVTTGEKLDDSAERGRPMVSLQGARNLVRGLERALPGRSAGETFSVTVPPHQGYGHRQGGPQPVPRSVFPADHELRPGGSFTTQTPDGKPMVLWIDRIDGDQVWVDPHHPLAGRTLRYDITLLSVRPATPEEARAGHPLRDDVDA